MASTTTTVIIAIVVIVLVIVLVTALSLYEVSERRANQNAANAAAKAAKTAGKVPAGNNSGGGGPGNGGSNAGGAAGNTSWPNTGGTLDLYYQAQFPNVTFVPGKGFLMPVVNKTLSPNSTNTWTPHNANNFPNKATLPYNSVQFEQFMSLVNGPAPSTLLHGASWDGEHTWCDSYAVSFANLGISQYLDSTATHWSPYFMTSNIPQAVSLTWNKESDDYSTTSITTDLNLVNYKKKYWDIHSADSLHIPPGSEILDSVTDTTSSDKKYVVSLVFSVTLEIKPNEQKTFKQSFHQEYDAQPKGTMPILIQAPAFFLLNVFFNKNYSYLPEDDSASSANPMFAAMVLSDNSFVDVTYQRGYGGKVINSVDARYPLNANNVFCVDYVLQSSVNNPPFLHKSNNHVICFAVPVPYFPKQFDDYLSQQLTLHPEIVFDMNAANP